MGSAGTGTTGLGVAPPPGYLLRADLVGKDAKIKLDGDVGEWPQRTSATNGNAVGVTFAGGIQYDAANLYVAGEIAGGSLVRTARFADDEDRVTLTLAFPTATGFTSHAIAMYVGVEGESAGTVRYATGARKGQAVAGAKIVDEPGSSGYSFEAAVPWDAFPEAKTLRVGLKGVLAFHRGATDLATGPGDAAHPGELAALPTESEQAVFDGLLTARGVADEPKFVAYADVTGDAMKEKVAVYGRLVTVCGPNYRNGNEFFVRELDADILGLEAKDMTGRGKDDLVVRRRFATGKDATTGDAVTHEFLEVWSVGAGGGSDEPETAFAHEVAIASGAKKVTRMRRASPRGRST
jgi:hypothetical protein